MRDTFAFLLLSALLLVCITGCKQKSPSSKSSSQSTWSGEDAVRTVNLEIEGEGGTRKGSISFWVPGDYVAQTNSTNAFLSTYSTGRYYWEVSLSKLDSLDVDRSPREVLQAVARKQCRGLNPSTIAPIDLSETDFQYYLPKSIAAAGTYTGNSILYCTLVFQVDGQWFQVSRQMKYPMGFASVLAQTEELRKWIVTMAYGLDR